MRAISINQYGGFDVLNIGTLPTPQIQNNEVLVKVHACGLNPVDFKIRAGHLKDLFAVSFPRILGGDISGVVVGKGADANDFNIGDEVYFSNPLDKDGGYREFCAVDQQFVARKPKGLTHLQAATLPVAGLTAIQSLRDFSKIKSGQKVLIHAGAGGVGSFAIPYAKKMGAMVFTTASPANHKYVKDLGADVIIDYNKEDFVSVCNGAGGMDIVLESIGGSNYIKSLQATKDGGYVPCIVNPPDDESKKLASQKGITTDFFLLSCSRRDLDEITKTIEAGEILPIGSKTLTFDEIYDGHKQLESGKVRGKLVLQIINDF